MEIYLYSRCSTCRDAERILADSGRPFRRRDFFQERFTADELKGLLERAGLTPAGVLSRRSPAYKDLNLDGRELTDGELLALMIQEPRLLRRPLIIAGEKTLVGFDRERIAALANAS